MPRGQKPKTAPASGSKKPSGKGKGKGKERGDASNDQSQLQLGGAPSSSTIAQADLKRKAEEAGVVQPHRNHPCLGRAWPHLLIFINDVMYIWPCDNFGESLPPKAPGYVATLVGHEDTAPGDLELIWTTRVAKNTWRQAWLTKPGIRPQGQKAGLQREINVLEEKDEHPPGSYRTRKVEVGEKYLRIQQHELNQATGVWDPKVEDVFYIVFANKTNVVGRGKLGGITVCFIEMCEDALRKAGELV
ncbi:hypothetical protein BOTBODRAFT_175251 [Botryobasidium botryosum FD-172 SS1]|uniref:Uncharacterized protein n=1 Tax=Botryobasidium botryosum (strain FD-172 SS1) TaxID=930990 RepID=A0A067MPR9_BOTB1|nr:hypothetical protein BOTBODRAFT_175251 [Botryobasidium botryosum FD-172 SS1]